MEQSYKNFTAFVGAIIAFYNRKKKEIDYEILKNIIFEQAQIFYEHNKETFDNLSKECIENDPKIIATITKNYKGKNKK